MKKEAAITLPNGFTVHLLQELNGEIKLGLFNNQDTYISNLQLNQNQIEEIKNVLNK